MSQSLISIDLHGLTVTEAETEIERKIQTLRRTQKHLKLRIITGKGLHSAGGQGVLARDIHHFVKQRFGPSIVSIQESPLDVQLGGVPIRGHFDVVLKF